MRTDKKPRDKVSITLTTVGIIGVVGGLALLLFGIFGVEKMQKEASFPQAESENEQKSVALSPLTGEILAEGALAEDPIYCVQIPNGVDGARPQAGLTEAGVVFEAIAEAGITRFAALFQDPNEAVIGPIRSLRMYYLQWDTPFDCTIVHAGGSDDALAALQAGGYPEIDENYNYMYRSDYGGRSWNNLFTTSTLLAEATAGQTSKAQGFNRLSQEEAEQAHAEAVASQPLDITKPAEGDTSAVEVKVPEIALSFGSGLNYNVVYHYDAESNTYPRSYASGLAHEVYECAGEDLGEVSPEAYCTLTQVAPAVVVAMVVQESLAADNYHENITTIGTGDAYIFANGTVVEGSWSKSSAADQIKFYDENGDEVKLMPGQTFVSAIPAGRGSVEY